MCLVNETLVIDLTQSWEISDIKIVSAPKPEELKARRDAILWYNGRKNQVYEFGGWPQDGTSIDKLWTFASNGSGSAVWRSKAPPLANDGVISPTFGAATTHSSEELFYLGGAFGWPTNVSWVNYPLPGFIIRDFADNSWTNASSTAASKKGYPVQVQAQYIPQYVTTGIVVVIGRSALRANYYEYEQGMPW